MNAPRRSKWFRVVAVLLALAAVVAAGTLWHLDDPPDGKFEGVASVACLPDILESQQYPCWYREVWAPATAVREYLAHPESTAAQAGLMAPYPQPCPACVPQAPTFLVTRGPGYHRIAKCSNGGERGIVTYWRGNRTMYWCHAQNA